MKVVRALTGAAVLLALAAGPAAARVEDPLELLGPGLAAALQDQLANVHGEDFDVVVTTRAPAGAQVEALQRFALQPRAASSGLVLVAMQDQQVGVALGRAYAERGVDAERALAIAEQVMPAAFERGVPSDGVVALVRELKLARTLGPRPGYVPPKPPPRTPWELLAAGGVALLASAVAALVRRARRRTRLLLEERLRGERGRLAKLREDLRGYEESWRVIRRRSGPEGELAEALLAGHAPLEAEQAEVREALRGLAERLEQRGPAGVAEVLAPLARRVERLHMGVATLGAAAEPLTASRGELEALLAEGERRLAARRESLPAAEGAQIAAAFAEAARLAGAEQPVAARAALAEACTRLAPADPDEDWLALMARPLDGPALAADLVARWAALERALAGEAGRDALRARVEELALMLVRARPDLVRARLLLEATEKLERARGGVREGRATPVGVA